MNEHTSAALIGLRVDALDVLCECGRAGCNELVTVSYNAYRSIRLQGAWFVVAKDHLMKGDSVVHRDANHAIVSTASSSAPLLPFDDL